MNIRYQKFEEQPNSEIIESIAKVHKEIFGGTDQWLEKLKSKQKVLVNIALKDSEVIGFKIGYALDEITFYSWLGGVSSQYRNYGVASELMKQQHTDLKEMGYEVVQTKTMNKWRNMLLMNIRDGFDIVGTKIDERGELKIILEKKLI
ncbi:GNAT family N-acetyltransferase [Metaplanococcus flavidus]|uniref:GNAT family N-acetyltransferase n=1 Tax=Metaplanococcus flavidus TaxID=569883 RepID=A0ABW3LDD9_9BACL